MVDGSLDLAILITSDLPPALEGAQLLRDEMLMGRLFENHLYYVGHLVELACFGVRFGFKLTPVQEKAATGCLNICADLINRYAAGMSRAEALLPFSHFRRGLTLWQSVLERRDEPLDAFTADFDAARALPMGEALTQSSAFNFAEDADRPSTRLQGALDVFTRRYPELPQPKGSIGHFRRLIPQGWDRRLHYEFLDYGDRIGVELHFESPDLVELLPAVRDAVVRLSDDLDAGPLIEKHFEADGAAKLALVFDEDAPPERIAKAMNALIGATREGLGLRMRGE